MPSVFQVSYPLSRPVRGVADGPGGHRPAYFMHRPTQLLQKHIFYLLNYSYFIAFNIITNMNSLCHLKSYNNKMWFLVGYAWWIWLTSCVKRLAVILPEPFRACEFGFSRIVFCSYVLASDFETTEFATRGLQSFTLSITDTISLIENLKLNLVKFRDNSEGDLKKIHEVIWRTNYQAWHFGVGCLIIAYKRKLPSKFSDSVITSTLRVKSGMDLRQIWTLFWMHRVQSLYRIKDTLKVVDVHTQAHQPVAIIHGTWTYRLFGQWGNNCTFQFKTQASPACLLILCRPAQLKNRYACFYARCGKSDFYFNVYLDCGLWTGGVRSGTVAVQGTILYDLTV